MGIQKSPEATGPVVLVISGMTCGGCAGAVGRALSAVSGAAEVRVDLPGGRATVTGTASAEDLVRAVEVAGFTGRLA